MQLSWERDYDKCRVYGVLSHLIQIRFVNSQISAIETPSPRASPTLKTHLRSQAQTAFFSYLRLHLPNALKLELELSKGEWQQKQYRRMARACTRLDTYYPVCYIDTGNRRLASIL